MSFYHQDDPIEPSLVVCDVQEEVYGKSAFEVFDFVDEMTRTQLGFDSLEDVNFEVYDGDLYIKPRTVPRKLYLALLEENKHLRRLLIAKHLDGPTDNYNWDDDALPDGPEGPTPSY